ncbi:hypothetical protein ACQXVK_06280 [Curtobacterium sp. AB451]|nr:hypothetical protein [Curtobacterium sp. B18]
MSLGFRPVGDDLEALLAFSTDDGAGGTHCDQKEALQVRLSK